MRLLIAIAAAALIGCASVAAPPGGPEDREPPVVIRATPDSGAVGVSDRRVFFHFDEIVSDRGTGTGALERLVVISPGVGEPRVSWHRDAIGVRPRDGWRPNTTYSVSLLPGTRDLRGNVSTTQQTIVFSTGSTLAQGMIVGRIFDWVAERPAPRARVEAHPLSDSTLRYSATADSAGRFALGPLAGGEYVVRGWVDVNANRIIDRNELSDTGRTRVADGPGPGQLAPEPLELLAAMRDTLPPRISTAAVRDSVTIILTFDRPLDPTQLPAPAQYRVLRSDSTTVGIASVTGARAFDRERQREDSLRLAEEQPRDTTRIARPAQEQPREITTVVEPPALPSRAPPETGVALLLGQPLRADSSYRVEASGIRTIGGGVGESSRVISVQPSQPSPDAAPSPQTQPARPAPARRNP
jgi:hypothetical protein